jgi:hypothetical protein
MACDYSFHGIFTDFGQSRLWRNSCYKRSFSTPLPLVTVSFSLGQKQGNGLSPSVTLTHDPLNNYD